MFLNNFLLLLFLLLKGQSSCFATDLTRLSPLSIVAVVEQKVITKQYLLQHESFLTLLDPSFAKLTEQDKHAKALEDLIVELVILKHMQDSNQFKVTSADANQVIKSIKHNIAGDSDNKFNSIVSSLKIDQKTLISKVKRWLMKGQFLNQFQSESPAQGEMEQFIATYTNVAPYLEGKIFSIEANKQDYPAFLKFRNKIAHKGCKNKFTESYVPKNVSIEDIGTKFSTLIPELKNTILATSINSASNVIKDGSSYKILLICKKNTAINEADFTVLNDIIANKRKSQELDKVISILKRKAQIKIFI